MTNSTKKMFGKNVERRSSPPKSERKVRSPKIQSATYFNTLATPLRGAKQHLPLNNGDVDKMLRLSPNGSSAHSPRTSPGLLSGHFAGGKWSEPPSPTELPIPPQQWTFAPKCRSTKSSDISKHLKMLLNVQA